VSGRWDRKFRKSPRGQYYPNTRAGRMNKSRSKGGDTLGSASGEGIFGKEMGPSRTKRGPSLLTYGSQIKEGTLRRGGGGEVFRPKSYPSSRFQDRITINPLKEKQPGTFPAGVPEGSSHKGR